ncbi:MAG: nucleoside hydrolase, partial [Candidatus Hodarchaeota archaeon]
QNTLHYSRIQEFPDSASGMEASYQIILAILEKMGLKAEVSVHRGSTSIMTSPDEPVQSDAAKNIIELAMQERTQPLYVIALGALTNVTSAILSEPRIKNNIVVEWLGGHPTYWYTLRESRQNIDRIGCIGGEPGDFNTWNDPYAAMTLFDSGVPIVWIPCKNVSELLRTVPCEIEYHVRGRGSIGNYLAEICRDFRSLYFVPKHALSTVLWDMTNIGYLVNPDWVPSTLTSTPTLKIKEGWTPWNEEIDHNLTWVNVESRRHLCRTAIHAQRDRILLDFYKKLDRHSK